ncbi:MAG: DUF2752 domain-containing protein [Acidobacteria bacterium]|nr:DUF2752 domain-containing protein [Acidobacteriota bacterium]MYF14169.1 DUF2752 domain-containing protein [Acidobacteriota bacterium]MYI97703.1 DUF2752 domain-containing protein [Acidobacteriota bacterium]
MVAVRSGRHQGLALLALSLISLGAAALLRDLAPDVTLCGVKALSGVPCPFCGGVRATAALGRGSLAEALAWNPAVTLLHAGMLTSGAVLVFGKTPVWLTPDRQRFVFRAVLVVLLANWLYLVAVGR